MKTYVIAVLLLLSSLNLKAQGPPIQTDKPIMLGGNTWIARSLTNIDYNEMNTLFKTRFMLHYTPAEKILIAVHAPFVDETNSINDTTDLSFGDIEVKAKYQFFRKDGIGKTLRMAAKIEETFPTGLDLNEVEYGLDAYQTYIGGIVGYETLHYGLGAELGLKLIHDSAISNRIEMKAGFGLPVLKPTYPVNQLNFYFEYHGSIYLDGPYQEIHFGQGVQYAIKRFTAEFGYRHALLQDLPGENKNKNGIIFGFRYIIN